MAEDLKVALKITGDAKAAVSAMGELIDSLSKTKLEFAAATREAKALQKAAEKDPTKAEAYKVAAQRVEELRYRISLLSNEVKDQLNDPTVKVREGAEKTKNSVGSLATGLKALAGAAVVKEFISANASIESIGASLEAVTGSAESAKREMAFIRAESMRLGVETAAAASSFLTLAAATKGTSLEGEKTREIWSAVAGKMTQLGATSADVAGAMTQLAQGASKGKFELEDLKSIADRIPGFFGTFAEAIGVTNKQFFEMVSQGQITADLLPHLANALSDGGGEINTFNANLGRLKNAFTDLAITIGDTGIFQALSTATRAGAFGVTLLVNEFVLLGKTLGNVAYTVASLDFSGFMTRQNALIDETKAKLAEAEKQIFGTGESAVVAGNKAKTGFVAMAEGAKEAEKEIKGSVKVVNELVAAYETLGLKSQIELDMTAKAAKNAYETIVRMGAPLTDQNAAWGKWAEAAIAANGGVASSTLQAEAAQHRMTISIDETGKASVRTLDVLERMEAAALLAASANTQAMESAAIAASQARTSIGTMQGSIDGFVEHLHGMGEATASIINAARQEMFGLSEAALEMFNSMRAGFEGGTMGAWMADIGKNTATVTTLFNQQAAVAEYWRQRLADGVDTAGDLTTATQVLGSQLTILGNEQLDPLRNAIADAERRMLDLRNAAQSTLDNIQDEWDQLNNNLDDIERRRAAKREAELQAQIAAAKASGDKEAIADLAKALELLKQVTAARIEDAKQREKDAASNKATSTSKSSGSSGGITTSASGTPRSGGTTNIIINGTVTNSPAELARLLKPDLDRLQRLGG